MQSSPLIKLKMMTKSLKQEGFLNELIRIDNRFVLTTVKYQHQYYNAYSGVDIKDSKWIVAYLKLSGSKVSFSNKVKEQFRNMISAKVIWEGNVQINKTLYFAQVHEKLGPSMSKMFETIEGSLSGRQLLHLLLQILKLLQKLSNMRYVHGQLSPQLICFDPNPKKNDLYLLNCFHLRKKNQQIKPICFKYCSRGSHHGRSLQIKDDLESIVYILTDLYLDRTFLDNIQTSELQNKKNSLNLLQQFRSFPTPFIQFYCKSDFNFFYWKNYLYKILTPAIVNNPFTWMLANRENYSSFKQDKHYDYYRTSQLKQIQNQQLLQLSEKDMQNKEKMKGKVLKKISLQQIND